MPPLQDQVTCSAMLQGAPKLSAPPPPLQTNCRREPAPLANEAQGTRYPPSSRRAGGSSHPGHRLVSRPHLGVGAQ